MYYLSTRGGDEARSFTDVLLAGLAPDGGLYLPEQWPSFSEDEIRSFAGQPYASVAARVVAPFIGDDIPRTEIETMCEAAYQRFADPAVAPIKAIGKEDYVLELFHGPTLAFKDFAMQLLGRLFNYALTKQDKQLTIIGATSGDTGGAAIEALRGLDALQVFILHPEGKVSDVQRRMMTSVQDANIHNIAIQGSFDDCQTLVKKMFADEKFRTDIKMGAVNSINWARIMVQAVYYFTTVVALDGLKEKLSFVVPTGNFGDIFAGYVAARMGLPIEKLCIATNQNDILYRTLESNVYQPQHVHKTISPSMDIQISSNFERLLFEASGRDAVMVGGLMSDLDKSGKFTIPQHVLDEIRTCFVAERADEVETRKMIASTLKTTEYLTDPHTAIGLVAAQKARSAGKLTGRVVTLSTAHPAKFPEAVKEASGIEPALPEEYKDLLAREERYSVLANDLSSVKQHVLNSL